MAESSDEVAKMVMFMENEQVSRIADECIICLHPLYQPDAYPAMALLKMTCCDVVIHVTCQSQWVLEKRNCPHCMQAVDTSAIFFSGEVTGRGSPDSLATTVSNSEGNFFLEEDDPAPAEEVEPEK